MSLYLSHPIYAATYKLQQIMQIWENCANSQKILIQVHSTVAISALGWPSAGDLCLYGSESKLKFLRIVKTNLGLRHNKGLDSCFCEVQYSTELDLSII